MLLPFIPHPISLFPVICFELSLTRTFLDFPRKFQLSGVDCINMQVYASRIVHPSPQGMMSIPFFYLLFTCKSVFSQFTTWSWCFHSYLATSLEYDNVEVWRIISNLPCFSNYRWQRCRCIFILFFTSKFFSWSIFDLSLMNLLRNWGI